MNSRNQSVPKKNGGSPVKVTSGCAASGKWLTETGKTPPPAFLVPLDEAADRFVKAQPDGIEGEKRVREWAVSDFRARFAGPLDRFTEDRNSGEDTCADCDKQIERERVARDKLEKNVTYTTTEIRFPSGTQLGFVLFVAGLFCSLILVEWLNMAGFAERSEMQFLLPALGYTFSAALIPLAMEFAFFDQSRIRRVLSVIVICLAGFFFVHLFSDAYVSENPNATSGEVLRRSDAPTVAPRFWNDPFNPHWRLVWQLVLATSAGMPLARSLSSQVTVIAVTKSKPNPARVEIEKGLEKLLKKRGEAGKRFAEAEGNIKEWHESEKLHVAWRLWLFDREQRRRKLFKEAHELLLKEANDASTPPSFWSDHLNHKER